MILSFEVSGSQTDGLEDKTRVYRDAIWTARDHLTERKHDSMAECGIMLINAIFPEPKRLPPLSLHTSEVISQRKVDFNEVITRFAANRIFLRTDIDNYFFDDAQICLPVEHGDEAQDQYPVQTEDDLEAWFRDVFDTTSTMS